MGNDSSTVKYDLVGERRAGWTKVSPTGVEADQVWSCACQSRRGVLLLTCDEIRTEV